MNVLGAAIWTADAQGTRPEAQLLPTRMRGRASLLTAMLVQVVDEATRAAAVDPRVLPLLYGSAYGEMGTMQHLLDQLGGDAQLSPAKFQASVHNTASGQLSIALSNPVFSTAIAAGHDTLAMLLLEAHAYLAREPGTLVVACADEGSSAALQPAASYAPLAAAFVLASAGHAQDRALAELSAPRPREGEPHATPLGNPCAPALELARAVFSGQTTTLDLNASSACGYSVDVRARSPQTHGV